MKLLKTLLILTVSMIILGGCSNKNTSRLYFDSKPYNYITGTNNSNTYDFLFYKLDGLNRFYLQETEGTTGDVINEYWGGWTNSAGVYSLTTEEGLKVRVSGTSSTPHIVATDIPALAGAKLSIAKNLYLYHGVEESGDSQFVFDLRLFEQGKTIPIYLIPPKHQENTFVLRVQEKVDGEVVDEDEFIGYWNIKERILFLKMEDSFMHFKTERNSIDLISPDNRYDLKKITLEKIK